MTKAQNVIRHILFVSLISIVVAACVEEEPSICNEHMGSRVTVYADDFQAVQGEMFYCYGDSGFSIVTEKDKMISFPYHSVNAVIVTEKDFLIDETTD